MVYYLWSVVPGWMLGGRAAAPLLLVPPAPCNLLHYGGCRVPRSLFFFFLLCPIKSPLRGWAPPLPSSSSFLLPLFFLLLLLGFYLNQLILVFIFVRVTVDLLARATDLLMFITLVNW